MDDYLEGGELTWDGYATQVENHWVNDAFLGTGSFVLARGGAAFIDDAFMPPQNAAQRIVYGGMQAVPVGAANTDLLDAIIPDVRTPQQYQPR